VKRIAVVTTFVDLLEAFSLCGVVESQVKLLLRNSYPTTFVACEGFRANGTFGNPALRHLRLPNFQIKSDGDAVRFPSEFASKVEAIKSGLRPLLPDIDVVITHDIIYLQQHLAYNQACRELADEFPHVFWLHWIHSAPEPHRSFSDCDPRSARYKRFPRGMLIYPNAYDVVRVSRQYGVGQEEVRVIPHGLDYSKTFNFHPLSKALIERYKLYSPDIFAIYPIRMDRGKQPEKLVRLFSEIKKAGKTVCLLIVNFHSTGQHFIEYRDDIMREARGLGLTDEQVIFTNGIESLPGVCEQELQKYRVEFPHKVVMDLFHLSNIYVHPSASETYSLVCQEAAACGNLLFLNDDFPPMREIYGSSAHYIKFSSTLFTTTHSPSESAYYAEIARKIFHHLEVDQTVKQKTRIRQTRNLQAVFRNHLEPLFYAD
jgi:glycosyltransferase involved in cell wall biosynthesis